MLKSQPHVDRGDLKSLPHDVHPNNSYDDEEDDNLSSNAVRGVPEA